MSDFLTHLAARAIAQPTLRPRTRMRFEPQAIEEAPAVPDVRQAPSPVRTEPTQPMTGEAPVLQAEVITRDVVRTRVEPRIEREIRHTIESRERVTKEREHERVLQPETTTIRERERITQPETTTIRERVPHRIEIEKPRVIATREEIEREVEVPVETPRVRAQAGEPALHQQQPDIHITIGRVEVRAVAPQQTKRPAQRSGVMTLDDYAAKRKERR